MSITQYAVYINTLKKKEERKKILHWIADEVTVERIFRRFEDYDHCYLTV